MDWWLFFSDGERSYLDAARAARRCSAKAHELATEHTAELAKAHYVDVDIEVEIDDDLIYEDEGEQTHPGPQRICSP